MRAEHVATENAQSAGVAGRYATALFELAADADGLDRVAGDLDAFQKLYDDSTDLKRLVRSPVFSAESQARAIAAVTSKMEVAPLTSNFFSLLARNRRLFAVGDIIKGYKDLYARHKGEVSAEVTSAQALSDQQQQALQTALDKATGRRVKMDTRVDPGILGGLVVKVGSRMIDSSIKTKLSSLKFALKEVR